MKRLILILLFLLLASGNVLAASYYLKNGGNDSADGFSDATAWATIAKVNSAILIAGDSVLFNCGDTWRETLTVPSSGSVSNQITFGTYGSGSSPIITGSNLITAGWSKYSNNVWKATVTTKPTIVYFNGTRGTLVGTKASITSEYKWYWESNILYVWSPSDLVPSSYYITPGIEVGVRVKAADINDMSYITVDGITFRDGNHTQSECLTIGGVSTVGIIVRNCTVERGSSFGISIGGTSVSTSFTIDNCIIRNNGRYGIWVSSEFSRGIISNNQIYNNGIETIRDNTEGSGLEGYLGNVDVFGNTIYGNAPSPTNNPDQSHGIYINPSTAVANIHDNIIHSQPNGEGLKLKGSANVYRNLIYGNYNEGSAVAQNGAVNISVIYYNNIIYGNNLKGGSTGGISVGIEKGTGTMSVSIENNTFYHNANTGSGPAEINIMADITALTVKNNILFTSDTKRTLSFNVAQTGTLDIDYNCYWQSVQSGAPNIRYGVTYPTWAEWQALGYDTHAVNVNPLLTFDYQLQSGSPCIDAGVITGLTDDYRGHSRPVGAGYDIGAYEYSGITPDTAAPSAVSNLSITGTTTGTASLRWTSSGDDGASGTATSYDIRYSTSIINISNWASASQVSGEPAPQSAGAVQTMTVSGLSASTTYYFAMKISDEVPNTSGLSNVASGTTSAVPDTTAPSAVSNLSITGSTTGTASLRWTSSGDDGAIGTAASYDIRYSTSIINISNWASASQVSGEPAPQSAGAVQTMTVSGLSASTTYYFAMKISDEVPNTSGLSNVASVTTSPVPDTSPPYTTGHNPAKNAINISPNSNIIVHVKDDGAGVDINTIVMRVNGVIVTPVITGTPADYTLTYDPPADFVTGQTITLTVSASDLSE